MAEKQIPIDYEPRKMFTVPTEEEDVQTLLGIINTFCSVVKTQQEIIETMDLSEQEFESVRKTTMKMGKTYKELKERIEQYSDYPLLQDTFSAFDQAYLALCEKVL